MEPVSRNQWRYRLYAGIATAVLSILTVLLFAYVPTPVLTGQDGTATAIAVVAIIWPGSLIFWGYCSLLYADHLYAKHHPDEIAAREEKLLEIEKRASDLTNRT